MSGQVVEVAKQQNFRLLQSNIWPDEYTVQQKQGLMTTDGFQDYETHRCMHLTDTMKL